MGSYLSVLFLGGEQEDDAGAATLLELLDDLPGNNNDNDNNPVVNWDAMGRRLRRHPEEAAAFCHTVDPSPLLQCLLSSVDRIPARVIHAFVSAYDDAVYHADQQGTTPLLAAVRRTTTTTTTIVVTANDSDNNPHPQQPPETNTDDHVVLWRHESRQIIQLLLQANPGAARQADRSGVVPLHHVRGDAIVAQQLYEKNPTAIEQRDCQGRLPLHYYCRLWQQDPPSQQIDDNGDNDNENDNGEAQQQQQQDEEEDAVMRRPQEEQLDDNDIENDPLRQRRNNPPQQQQQQQTDRDMHMMPLPNPQVARLLVGGSKPTRTASAATTTTTTPTNLALLKDYHGVTPLDILYQELQTTLQLLHNNTSTTTTHTSTHTTNSNPNQRQRHLLARAVDTLWEILIIVVHAAVGFQTFQMVHALVALHCPPTVMAEALRRYPQQALERDALGRTPLLLAVEMLDHNNNNSNSTTNNTTSIAMKDHQEERAAAVCRELIRFNPVAARMTDREGRLAIDLLSEKGFYNEELFEAFVKAEPRAIDTRDLKNKQHPFLTAALAPDNKSNVAIVYHLLRAKPHVIQYFLDDHK